MPTTDPLGRPVVGAILLSGDTAYVESAQAYGLHLLTAAERDPLVTTSYGIGALLAAAVECGAATVVVGLGGSATNDAGMGMLAALGVTPLDAAGTALPYGGLALAALDRLEGTAQLRGARLVAATDVDNPLCGPHGATAVFGPQKGAAAGGLRPARRGAGPVGRGRRAGPTGRARGPGRPARAPAPPAAWARRCWPWAAPGSPAGSWSRDAVDLAGALAGADLVITGEGSFDSQSLRGKVAGGVAKAATAHGVPCLVLAGQVVAGAAGGGGRGRRGGVLGGRAGRLGRGRAGAPGRPPVRARGPGGPGVEPGLSRSTHPGGGYRRITDVGWGTPEGGRLLVPPKATRASGRDRVPGDDGDDDRGPAVRGPHRRRGRQGQGAARPGGPRRPAAAHRRAAGRLLRPALLSCSSTSARSTATRSPTSAASASWSTG